MVAGRKEAVSLYPRNDTQHLRLKPAWREAGPGDGEEVTESLWCRVSPDPTLPEAGFSDNFHRVSQ